MTKTGKTRYNVPSQVRAWIHGFSGSWLGLGIGLDQVQGQVILGYRATVTWHSFSSKDKGKTEGNKIFL